MALKSTVKFPLFGLGFWCKSEFERPEVCCCKFKERKREERSIFCFLLGSLSKHSPIIALKTHTSFDVPSPASTGSVHSVHTCRCVVVVYGPSCTGIVASTCYLGLPFQRDAIRELNEEERKKERKRTERRKTNKQTIKVNGKSYRKRLQNNNYELTPRKHTKKRNLLCRKRARHTKKRSESTILCVVKGFQMENEKHKHE